MLTIRFSTLSDPAAPLLYRVHLDSPAVGQAIGAFRLPFDAAIQRAIQQALAPNFRLDAADANLRQMLQALGPLAQLPMSVGMGLTQALLADPTVASHFDSALHLAMSQRQPLPVELRFGAGCDSLADLPWELLHYRGRFLVADSSIALSRYPEGLLPPTPTHTELPLRVLLMLSEPLDAGPILPHQARYELLHGLRRLGEQGAVVVDELRPPTFQTLTEALTIGEYHLLVFYGHGLHQAGQGYLLFEDEFGGQSLVRADALGALVRNSSIRLVLLGACESAAVSEDSSISHMAPDMWSGTAPTLVRAGVPLAVGMQVMMRVDAALAFLRQFALSLAVGKAVIVAVSDARKALLEDKYQQAWFIPALYGRPLDDYRLFDPAQPLPASTTAVRQRMQTERLAIERLEAVVTQLGMLDKPGKIALLRAAKWQFAQAHAELAQRTPGGYAPVTSPLYGVPSNPVFAGRQQILIQTGQSLKQIHPVVLWGPGGIGKSAVAIEAAHRQGWRFGGGVLWLDCRGGPAFDTLLDRVAAFCGIEAPDQLPPAEKMMTVRAALASLNEPVLLIWDNAEDVWNNRDVRHFLYNRPTNVQVLLTTRENPEEIAWTVIELTRLADQPMKALFGWLAGRAGVKVPSHAEADLISQLIAWLEGHPLALMLVVPLVAKRGIQRVWQELQRQPLKGIESALAVSFERLTSDQQHLFMRLSIFAIPFDWAAAEAMFSDQDEVDEMLDVLVQRALIKFDGARYSFHTLLRQFAFTRLQGQEDVRRVHRLAAAYLQSQSVESARTPEERLEEVDQWEKAEEWSNFVQRAKALIGSLDRLGYWGEIETRLVRAQAVVQVYLNTESVLTAQLLNARGTIVYKQTHWDTAITLWTQAQHLYKQIGDIYGQASIYSNLGLVYYHKGAWDIAIEYYQQALSIKEQMGDIHDQASVYSNLGNIYAEKGAWDKAIKHYQQVLPIFKQVGDIHGQAIIYNNLGSVYKDKGAWDKAIEYYQQALLIYEQVGDIHSHAQTYHNLGLVYADKGAWDKAIEYYQQVLSIYERVGDIHGQAQSYNNLGGVYANKKESDKAIEYHQLALRIYEQVGDIQGQASAYHKLGIAYYHKGAWDKAIEYYQQVLPIFKQVGDTHSQASVYGNLGLVYADKRIWDKAIEYCQQALPIYEQLGDIHGQASVYGNLGIAYHRKGVWDKAIEYYQQVLPIFKQVGDIHGQAQSYNNLGGAYADKGAWDKAIEYYQRALPIYEQVGDIYGQARVYGNLGLVYHRKGAWDKAIEYYQRALSIYEQVGDIHGQASTYGNLGVFYRQQGDNEQAARYMAFAFLLFANLGANVERQQAGEQLVDWLGSVEAANDYLAQFVAENTEKTE